MRARPGLVSSLLRLNLLLPPLCAAAFLPSLIALRPPLAQRKLACCRPAFVLGRRLVSSMASSKPEETYKEIAGIPTVTGGFLVSRGKDAADPPAVMLRRSQKDLANNEARASLLSFLPSTSGKEYLPQPFPSELRDVLTMAPSPSGRLLAVVRSRAVNGNKEQSLEVWDGGSLVASVSGNGEMHGAVYVGDVFSCLEWDAANEKLLYVAERKAKEASSFWQGKPATAPEYEGARWGGPAFEKKPNKGEEFAFVDDWGELCTGKSVSQLFVLHVPSGELQQVCAPEDGWAAGQGVWAPGGHGIVFTAFSYEPRRLGVRFYNTRKSKLCYARAPEFGAKPSGTQGIKASSCERSKHLPTAVTITPEEDWSARSPRFSPDGKKLAYVVSADSAAHFSCSKLCLALWPSGAPPGAPLPRKVVVDVVYAPPSDKSFPGLFGASEQLPRNVWLSDSRTIVTHCDWRCQREIILIDTEGSGEGAVVRLEAGEGSGEGSWVLLDVQGMHILASRSSPSCAPAAFLMKLGGSGGEVESLIPLSELLPASQGAALLDDIEWAVMSILPEGETLSFDALLVESKSAKAKAVAGKKVPLVLYPHGGPHSNQGVDFYPSPTLLALHGYAVLIVNYRGSTGYGQGPLESLCGKIGRQDVDDLVLAAKQCLDACPHIDKDSMVACGGSHGGFLSLHLVGQFPNMFKAAAVRNPVTNIASMFGVTDIPDWCYTEIGVQTAYSQPTAEQYTIAIEKSPMAHLSKVSSPVLLLVGGSDRRVPPSQSKEYFHGLRDRGADCEMRWYPDHTHGLTETVRGEGDGLVHIVNFFDTALGKLINI